MEDFIDNKLKPILMKLGNRKSHLLINIGGLSVSFAAFLLIMTFVISEFNFDKFVLNGPRIYRVEESDDIQVPRLISHKTRETFPEVENSVVIKSINNHWVSYNQNFYEIKDFCFAENSMIEIFSLPFLNGDPKTALEASYTIVLAESVAKMIFGDKNPIGEQVNFKDQGLYTVTGVIADLPDFHLPIKAVASFKTIEEEFGVTVDNTSWGLVTYVMLTENHNKDVLERKMNELFTDPSDEELPDYNLRPFNDIYLATDVEANDETKHGNLELLIILIVTGILILVIASINFINLSISMGLKQSHEITIRMIHGCSKKEVVLRQISNSLLLCFISFLLSLIIAFISFEYYEILIGRELNLSSIIRFDYVLLCFAGLIIYGIICGLIPALYLIQNNSDLGLRERLASKKNTNFNLGLITFQYAISIILICGTILTFNQLNFIQNRNLGFDKDLVMTIELTEKMKKNLDGFKEQLLKNSNISAVSFLSDEITQLHEYKTAVPVDGENSLFNYAVVDPDFVSLMDINVVSGDNFSWDIRSQMTEGYIVNESGWKILENSDLKYKGYSLGKRRLIGVVNDFHFESLHKNVFPMLFIWGEPDGANNMLVKLSNDNYGQTIDYIKDQVRDIAPGSICKYSFLDQSLNELYESENKVVSLLGMFSLLAILIASVGVFSLSSIAAENRTKEIGIRKVNGAKTKEIIAMLNIGVIKWVIVAFLIASPIAWYAMDHWLESFAYRTTISWWIFALAGLSTLIISILTVTFQSWIAARKNPVESLRYE